MMNANPSTEAFAPLQVEAAVFDDEKRGEIVLRFSRDLTDAEVERLASLPPATELAEKLAEALRTAMLSEVVARLCRTYVLAGIAFPEGAEVTKWLRAYIDGEPGCGPLGAPMPWPDPLPQTAAMLRKWGFARSPNGWVVRAPAVALPGVPK
jgi:hypothetical protein